MQITVDPQIGLALMSTGNNKLYELVHILPPFAVINDYLVVFRRRYKTETIPAEMNGINLSSIIFLERLCDTKRF